MLRRLPRHWWQSQLQVQWWHESYYWVAGRGCTENCTTVLSVTFLKIHSCHVELLKRLFIAWAVFSMCITNLYKFYYSLWCILFAAINLLSINPFVNNLPLHFPFAVMHNNNKWKINWIIFQEYFICWVAVNITICNFKIMDRYILKYQKPVVVILLCIYWINSQSAHWLCQRQDYKFNYFMSWELTK